MPYKIETLYLQHKDAIYRYIVRMIGPDAAEDLTQEVFLKAFRGLKSFRGDASVKNWLFKIALNLCRDYLRRQKLRHLFWHSVPSFRTETANIPDPTDNIDNLETQIMIQEALGQVPAKFRELIILKDLEGFSYAEISQLSGCKIGTVKSRLFYGRLLLAGKLSDLGYQQERGV